jgi:hypothetical protein
VAKPKRDFTQVAHDVFRRAIGEAPPVETPPADESPKVRAGRAGGKKGGTARAAKLTPEERSEAARRAAQGRWLKRG